MSVPATTDIWITAAVAVTALGESLDATWQAVLAGKTAGTWVDLRTLAGRSLRVPAAPICLPFLSDVPVEISSVRSERMTRRLARQIMATPQLNGPDLQEAAVAIGSSKPSVCTWFVKSVLHREWSAQQAMDEALHLPDYLPNPTWDTFTPQRSAVVLSQSLGCQGPILSGVSACSTGLHCIIRAVQWLQEGDGQIAIAGAVESGLNPLFSACFARMGVLADNCQDAAIACRPFDKDRSGFVIGEGAAALVLETPDHARQRGVRPIAVITSYARGADPTGLADMDPQGRPLAGVIGRCMAMADIEPRQVACIKAHGTATRANDVAESAAICSVFANTCPPVISLKGHLGHCLGASGAVEAALCSCAIANGRIPVTANLTCPDPECRVNHPRRPLAVFEDGAEHMLCLSAGFGGHLAAVLLRRPRQTD